MAKVDGSSGVEDSAARLNTSLLTLSRCNREFSPSAYLGTTAVYWSQHASGPRYRSARAQRPRTVRVADDPTYAASCEKQWPVVRSTSVYLRLFPKLEQI